MDLEQNQWKSQLDKNENAVILDVRTEEEWEEGFIPNAVLLDIYKGPEFIRTLEALDKSKAFFVYCKSGGRSQQACHIMNQMGFDKTYNLTGGFSKWNGAVTEP